LALGEKVSSMPANLTIRPMQPTELDFAAACTAAEGWVSEDRQALQSFYHHDPHGCLLAELDGQPAGICVATAYQASGFIGELIVRPAGRGQGIGAALLNHGVRYLKAGGAQTVYLDGVLKAVALYERNGFRKVCRSLRFSSQDSQLQARHSRRVRLLLPADLPAVCAIDRLAFGADRSFFLANRQALYPELCQALVEDGQVTGFLLGRRGEKWAAAGPWVVSPQASHPLDLLESFAAGLGGQPFSLGVLACNQPLVEQLRALGFSERPDSPWRMALGARDDLGASPLCLAVGGAAKG
jgi:ribosomal protein S18 acetylase RimI-like enzyme